jgi:hypothetical protein
MQAIAMYDYLYAQQDSTEFQFNIRGFITVTGTEKPDTEMEVAQWIKVYSHLIQTKPLLMGYLSEL